MLWQTACLLVVSVICVKCFVFLQSLANRWGAVRNLPCPTGVHWLWGHLPQGPFNPGLEWLRHSVTAFPRAFIIWLGPYPFPVLVHPDTIRPILSKSSTRSELYQLFRDWLGEGLFTSNGSKWKRHRRLLTGCFHFDVLRTYFPVYNDCVEVLLEKMDRLVVEGKPVEVEQDISKCTLDVILRTTCSHQSNCQLSEKLKEGELDFHSATMTLARIIQARQTGNPLLLSPWIFRFSSLYTEWRQVTQYERRVATELIEMRKEEMSKLAEVGTVLTTPRDFLDTILMARDEDGTGLTVEEITDELITFLVGGHETTSAVLSWALYLLAKHTEHQTKIREEVDDLLTDRDSDRITSNDLSRMDYTSQVIKETMRMYPATVQMTHSLTSPHDVEGVTLPTGTTVVVNLYQLHHNPTVWGSDHMDFKPSRFHPENISKMDPYSFLAFSAGPRNCLGQRFALDELKVLLARILRRFYLSLVEGEPEPVPSVNVAIRPMHKLLLNVEPRHGQ